MHGLGGIFPDESALTAKTISHVCGFCWHSSTVQNLNRCLYESLSPTNPFVSKILFSSSVFSTYLHHRQHSLPPNT